MRISTVVCSALTLLACTSTVPLANEPLDRCDSTDCFNQLQIRDYEVVDNSTLVVYVGSQNCPFRVEFSGAFCDLTFMPGGRLVLRPDTMRSIREPSALLTRVCAHDSNIGIDEGPFSRASGGDDLSDPRIPCRIQDIVSLTDDELLELYVEKRIAPPPPPFGTGSIQVPDNSETSERSDDSREGEDGQDPDPAAN